MLKSFQRRIFFFAKKEEQQEEGGGGGGGQGESNNTVLFTGSSPVQTKYLSSLLKITSIICYFISLKERKKKIR